MKFYLFILNMYESGKKYFSIILILSLIILALFGCSPQQRMNRLIKKHPELIKKDSIHIKDYVYIPQIKIDSIILLDTLIKYDSIIMQKDRMIVKVKYKDKFIYLTGQCKGDTFYIDRKIPVEKVIYKQSKTSFYIKILLLIAGIFSISYLINALKK